MQDKTKENPTNFKAEGKLSSMFEKAKSHNRFNSEFQSQVPAELSGIPFLLLMIKRSFSLQKTLLLPIAPKDKKSC